MYADKEYELPAVVYLSRWSFVVQCRFRPSCHEWGFEESPKSAVSDRLVVIDPYEVPVAVALPDLTGNSATDAQLLVPLSDFVVKRSQWNLFCF